MKLIVLITHYYTPLDFLKSVKINLQETKETFWVYKQLFHYVNCLHYMMDRLKFGRFDEITNKR